MTVRSIILDIVLPLFIYQGKIGPVFIYRWAAWKRNTNFVRKSARGFISFIWCFIIFGYWGFLLNLLEQGILNTFMVFIAGYVFPVAILNKISARIWGFSNLGARVMTTAQIHLHEVADNRKAKVYPNASGDVGKKCEFVLGVKDTGEMHWYSLSSFISGFEVEPFHILILGEQGVFRENFSDYLLLRAVECNSQTSFVNNRIWHKIGGMFLPDVIRNTKTVSNCVIIGLDDADSGLQMNHLVGLPGVTIFTGTQEIKRALLGLHAVFEERKDFVEDGNVNIFVLCDHGIASAIIGKNPAYLDVEREIKQLVFNGIRRKIKFIVVPDANMLEQYIPATHATKFRCFQFHSRSKRVKISRHDYVQVETEPEIPGLFHYNAPEGKIKLKAITITPKYLREKLSRLELTPQAQYIWSRMTHDLPEYRGKKKESGGKEQNQPEAKKIRNLPPRVEEINGRLFKRMGVNKLIPVIESNGVYYEKRGNNLRMMQVATQEEILVE